MNKPNIGDRRYAVVLHEIPYEGFDPWEIIQPPYSKRVSAVEMPQPARRYVWVCEENVVVWVGKEEVFCEKHGVLCEEYAILPTGEFLSFYERKEEAEREAQAMQEIYGRMLHETTCVGCKFEGKGKPACNHCTRAVKVSDNYQPITKYPRKD